MKDYLSTNCNLLIILNKSQSSADEAAFESVVLYSSHRSTCMGGIPAKSSLSSPGMSQCFCIHIQQTCLTSSWQVAGRSTLWLYSIKALLWPAVALNLPRSLPISILWGQMLLLPAFGESDPWEAGEPHACGVAEFHTRAAPTEANPLSICRVLRASLNHCRLCLSASRLAEPWSFCSRALCTYVTNKIGLNGKVWFWSYLVYEEEGLLWEVPEEFMEPFCELRYGSPFRNFMNLEAGKGLLSGYLADNKYFILSNLLAQLQGNRHNLHSLPMHIECRSFFSWTGLSRIWWDQPWKDEPISRGLKVALQGCLCNLHPCPAVRNLRTRASPFGFRSCQRQDELQ